MNEDYNRINELRKELQKHSYQYYVLDSPLISDIEYDMLFQELQALEKQYPHLIIADSPTQRVGHAPLKAFQPFKHISRMYSLDNAFNKEDIENWIKKCSRITDVNDSAIVAEPKLDGLSIEIEYKNGELISAGTRGDGFNGEDVTLNIKTIRSIPLSVGTLAKKHCIDVLPSFRIRGEILMTHKDFVSLNKERQEKNEPLFANPRNAAAGSLRQLDSAITSSRKLTAYFYQLTDYPPSLSINTQFGILNYIKALGFPVNPEIQLLQSVEEVFSFHQHLLEIRSSLPYEIDGAVFKFNSIPLWSVLGATSRAPRWAIAYKFQAESATTIIQSIRVSVGRSGILTPVAELLPVNVGGVTVSNASLHNEDEIARKDIRIGDTVLIQRAGDVIPEVIEVDFSKRNPQSVPFHLPDKCPVCNSPVIREQGKAYTRCVNVNCPARIKESFSYFVSKAGMDIDGIGKKILKKFIDEKIINDISDLFIVKEKDLISLEGIQEKLARKIVLSIQEAKNRPLWRFISAIGIEGVGETNAKLLCSNFNTISDFLSITYQEVVDIPGIGPETANNILQFLQNKRNIQMITHCIDNGCKFINKLYSDHNKKSTHVFSKKSFVITGVLSVPRSSIKEKIEEFGGTVKSSLSKKTDYLLVGENPGSKLSKAKELGIKIITEKDFIDLSH